MVLTSTQPYAQAGLRKSAQPLSPITLGSSDMTIRHILAVAVLTAIYQLPCSSQELPPPLAGRWQYLQPPDTEGEVLDLVASSDHWRGIMNGLERAGEHGLFYYVVEVEKLAVAPDGSISFEIGERAFFTKRPALSHLGGNGDGGLARTRMRFSGRIVGEDIVLQCNDEDGSCPGPTLRFKRLTTLLEPTHPPARTLRDETTQRAAPLR